MDIKLPGGEHLMEEYIVLHAVTHFFAHASPLLIYSLVAVVLALESCGVPIANSTLLLLTGALASTGHANIWTLGVFAVCGSILGANMAYLIGLRGGRAVLLRVTQRFHIDPKQVEIAEQWFQRSGVWMVFVSRIIPYIRPFSCFPSGIARTPFLRFFASAALGSILWCSAVLYVGWSLGNRWGLAFAFIHDYTVPTICGVILLLVVYCLVMYRIKKTINHRLSTPTKSPRVTRPLNDRDRMQHA